MLPLVIAPSAVQMLLMVLTGWLERREREALAVVFHNLADVFGPARDISCAS